MANFATKVARIGLKWPILVNFQLFPGFPQKASQIDSKWPISSDSQLFQSFPTKAAHFWQNLKNFYFVGVHQTLVMSTLP